MCNITKCCTEVCPEHIKITDNAIIPLKERVVDAATTRWPGWGARSGTAPSARPAEAAAEAPASGPAAVQPPAWVHGIPEPRAGAPPRSRLVELAEVGAGGPSSARRTRRHPG